MTTKKDLAYYMALNYPLLIWQDPDDTAWFAKIPLLPGLITHSETWEGLPAMIQDAKEGYFAVSLEYGDPIPEPEHIRA